LQAKTPVPTIDLRSSAALAVLRCPEAPPFHQWYQGFSQSLPPLRHRILNPRRNLIICSSPPYSILLPFKPRSHRLCAYVFEKVAQLVEPYLRERSDSIWLHGIRGSLVRLSCRGSRAHACSSLVFQKERIVGVVMQPCARGHFVPANLWLLARSCLQSFLFLWEVSSLSRSTYPASIPKVVSTGVGVVRSTPACFRASSGYSEPPVLRKLRYF